MDISTKTPIPDFNLTTAFEDGYFAPEVATKRHLDAILAAEQSVIDNRAAIDALVPGVETDIIRSAHETNIAAAEHVIVREAIDLAHLIQQRDATLLTTREVAERLSLDVTTVRKMCQDGRIAATRIGRDYLIDPAALEKVRMPARGRPRLPDEAVKPESLKRRQTRP